MKRLCAILVLMVLMFGVSSVFAQDSLTEEKVSVSGGGGGVAGSLITVVSPSNAAGGGIGLVTIEEDVAISGGAGSAVSPTRMCVVNAELMGELDRLVVMLKKAEESNDKQSIKGIMEKIRTIKEEIRKDREECEQSPTQTVQAVSERIVKAIPTRVTSIEVRPVYLDKCSELNDWIEKKKHYDILYSLSDEELKNKGYSMGKEEIKKILEELEEGIKKIRVECETSTSGVVSAVRVGAVKPIAIAKPVIAVSGREITDYYKLKISNIMEETNTEQQIKELKGLRTEIDKLIEGLIKSKDEIKTEDISELVTEVKIRPNEIIADNVVIRTTEKNMLIKINRKNLRIKPTKTQVIIQDENLEIKAPELSIKNEVLKVGDSEVKIAASDVIGKIGIEPKEIELKEENAKAVYKIKTEENRKLIGLIPVKVQKRLTVDATNQNAEILKEDSPWWTFMSTKP